MKLFNTGNLTIEIHNLLNYRNRYKVSQKYSLSCFIFIPFQNQLIVPNYSMKKVNGMSTISLIMITFGHGLVASRYLNKYLLLCTIFTFNQRYIIDWCFQVFIHSFRHQCPCIISFYLFYCSASVVIILKFVLAVY